MANNQWYGLNEQFQFGNEAFANLAGKTATVKAVDSPKTIWDLARDIILDPYNTGKKIGEVVTNPIETGKKLGQQIPTDYKESIRKGTVNVAAILLAIFLIVLGLGYIIWNKGGKEVVKTIA